MSGNNTTTSTAEVQHNEEPSFPRNNEEDDGGTLVGPMLLVAVALALAVAGSWGWAVIALLLAILFAVCLMTGKIEQKSQYDIRFNVIHPGDIFMEMLQWETRYLTFYEENNNKSEDPQLVQDGRILVLAGIHAQIRKLKEGKLTDTSAVIGLESVYLVFRRFGRDDQVLIAAISLLALIAKNDKVREKILFEADAFGLNLPIKALCDGLERAKLLEHNSEQEVLAAELQRKGFLVLGALCDGSTELAQLAVQEGASDAALGAVNWFRCHSEVVNWALWALFILCYEHAPNKVAVIQGEGIPIVIEAMRHCSDSLEVSRHGIALLFDIMRDETADCQPGGRSLDIWRLRATAQSAGLHQVLLEILDKHSEASDVAMMGMELLAGTGYSKTT